VEVNMWITSEITELEVTIIQCLVAVSLICGILLETNEYNPGFVKYHSAINLIAYVTGIAFIRVGIRILVVVFAKVMSWI
jgi:hypothetical protein